MMMSVNQFSNQRRSLQFSNLEEAVAEVHRLAETPIRTLGQFSFPQIIDHLAHSFDISSGHVSPPPVPLVMRLVMPLLSKRLATKPMKPGVKLPKQAQSFFWDQNSNDLREALHHFDVAYERYRKTDPLPRHPLFGDMPRQRNEQIQCRHMELHLSFACPVEEPMAAT